ncbi:MAG: hypothetical protein AAF694_26325 [Bacteroidota bacterium]
MDRPKRKLSLKLLESISERREKRAIHSLSFIQLASVLSYFTPAYFQEKFEEIHQEKLSDADQQFLLERCTSFEAHGEYMLDDQIRVETLYQCLLSGKLKAFFRENDLDLKPQDLLETMLRAYVNENLEGPPPLADQDMDQLAATYQIANWFHSHEDEKIFTQPVLQAIPRPNKVQAFLKREELLTPFRRVTQNFMGREKELDDLRTYVDWLPKKGESEDEDGPLNIIDWKEKPPMLIAGIGGIGKSTLVAKFILEHSSYDTEGRIPFAYLDFDRPGLSIAEPLLIASEALRQLAIQFADTEIEENIFLGGIFEDIRQDIRTTLQFQTDAYSKSSSATRGNLYESILRQYLPQYQESLAVSTTPFLLVLDSFEEVQYRATPSEINNLFRFLDELTRIIPRMRLIIVGRSDELQPRLQSGQLQLDILSLGEFDEQSTTGYLKAKGITDRKLAQKIWGRFGGNPLTLELAAQYVLEEGKRRSIHPEDVDELFQGIDQLRVQEQLVRRNLRHIKDPKAQKIAFPGLLIRRISPEVIREILAVPCGLGEISLEEAGQIFSALEKEKFLLGSLQGGIVFHRKLRLALQDLIKTEFKEAVEEIHDRAVDFYAARQSPQDRAEYLYHRLMRGDDKEIIDELYNSELRPFLEHVVTDFSQEVSAKLAHVMGVKVPSDLVEVIEKDEWEEHMAQQIEDAISNGEEEDLRYVLADLGTRDERTHSGPLPYFEALLHTRLGNFGQALDLLANQDNPGKWNLRMRNLQCKTWEYKDHYQKAHKAVSNIEAVSAGPSQNGDLIERLILHIRSGRRGKESIGPEIPEILARIRLDNPTLESEEILHMVPAPYRRATRFSDLLMELIEGVNEKVIPMITELNSFFLEETSYKNLFQQALDVGFDKSFLEKQFRRHVEASLDAIIDPGIWEVTLKDALNFLEIYFQGEEMRIREALLGRFGEEVSMADPGFESTTSKGGVKDLISAARSLIEKDEISKAIQLLMDNADIDESLYNDLILLSGRFQRTENARVKGIQDNRDYTLEINRISSAFLHLLDRMK